jgi:exopolysaccharide biosynthesis polyprenyl glycosylphosphotransferase
MVLDGLALTVGFGGLWISSHVSGVPLADWWWLVAYPVLVLLLFEVRGLYEQRVRHDLLEDLRRMASLTAVAMLAVLAFRALLHDDPFLAAQGIRQWLVALTCLAAGRVAFSWRLRRAWARGDRLEPTLIVGAGHVGQLVAKRLREAPQSGLRPIGFLDKQPIGVSSAPATDIPVLGASWDFDRVVEQYGVQRVVIAFSTAPHEVLLRIIKRCDELDLSVSLVPRLYERMTDRPSVERLGGLPLLVVRASNGKGWQFAVKYGVDRVVACLGLVVLSPILGIASLAILISLGRPVLYRQPRVGRDGRPFEMLKFRSMRPLEPGRMETSNGDEDMERVTRVGGILRATSLDELPQLINVLRGEMSIVGPRPEQPAFAELFEQGVHRYDERHRVKSGITGWAQVHGLGRGSNRFEAVSMSNRVEWDNYYIENWSLWLDIKILLMTAAAVFRFRQT